MRSPLEIVVHLKDGEPEKVDREVAERFQFPYPSRLVRRSAGLPIPNSSESADALDFLTNSLCGMSGVFRRDAPQESLG